MISKPEALSLPWSLPCEGTMDHSPRLPRWGYTASGSRGPAGWPAQSFRRPGGSRISVCLECLHRWFCTSHSLAGGPHQGLSLFQLCGKLPTTFVTVRACHADTLLYKAWQAFALQMVIRVSWRINPNPFRQRNVFEEPKCTWWKVDLQTVLFQFKPHGMSLIIGVNNNFIIIIISLHALHAYFLLGIVLKLASHDGSQSRLRNQTASVLNLSSAAY